MAKGTKVTRYYKMEVAFDEEGNSPWDALWYEGDDEDLEVLDSQCRVEKVWKPPTVKLQRRIQTPDIYGFQLYFATTDRARQLLSPLTADTVEFLSLDTPEKKTLFELHPLLRVDLDEHAIVEANEGDNITVIYKYSFVRDQLNDDMHVFQVRQAKGSPARDAGYACDEVLVSSKFKELCEKNNLRGIVFKSI
jgi:hypothetical protein